VYFIQGGNRAYIRASVDLKRRLRQHNSEIVGGSCRTCGRGPWRYIVAIEGFRTLEKLLQREKWTVNSPPSKDVLLVVTHNPTEYSDPHDNYNYIKLLSIRKKRKKCTKKHKRFYGTY
jgi:predicted GIY-YIG superfamily endonuclease